MSGREEIDENNLRKLQIGPPPRVVHSVCSMQHIGQTYGRVVDGGAAAASGGGDELHHQLVEQTTTK